MADNSHGIDVIFFDWGGVIADDPGDDFLADLLRNGGANDAEIEQIYHSYMRSFMRGELSEAEYWEVLRKEYGLTIHDSISHEFTKWRGLAVNDGVLAVADRARALGKRTAILSNVIEPTYNVLVSTGHFSRFDEVIASCKVGYAKPELEIYHHSLELLKTTARRALFIDDKPRNLEPAADMGFKTILAEAPQQIIDDINQYLD